MKYFIYTINCLLLIMIPVAFVFAPMKPQTGMSKTEVQTKMLKSVVIKSNNKKEDKKIDKEEKKEEVKKEEKQEEKKVDTKEETKRIIPKSKPVYKQQVQRTQPRVAPKPTPAKPKTDVLETLKGKMSGYGPDCKGCSGNLASGINARNGNIYYKDKKYGKIRIVAGDRKYKFGTIVRIKNSKAGNNIIAIVLDRGGNIGIGKKFLFDLLYASSKEASKYEVSYNVTFEILRYGY